LRVTTGRIAAVQPDGYLETKVHYAGMKFADPQPMVYPTITAEPEGGLLEIRIGTRGFTRPEGHSR
jgi:hypothetical protein